MKKKFLATICCIVLGTVSYSGVVQAASGAFASHYEAAQNYLMQNQYSSSIVEFRKALRINYMDNSARIGLINAYLARATYYANQDKNYEKAANDFRSAIFYLKIYPNKEHAVQNSSGMIASAMENLNQCLKVISFDTTPSARYATAEKLRAIGNFSAAAFEFYKASSSDKLASDANMQIADLLKLLGNESKSAEFYELALNGNPNNGVLRMKYARTLDRIGRYDDAVVQYNAALANSKGDMEVLYALERIYLKKLAKTPNDADLNANIGAIKQAQGDFDSALSYYGKAERIDSSNVTTRLNAGTLFQQRKEYQKAIKSYDSVLTMYPDNVQAILYKAQVYKDMGDPKTAMTFYKKVLSLDPTNQIAKDELDMVVKETMTPTEYIAYLTQNGSGEDLYNYGYKLHKDNKIDEAISAYKMSVSKNYSKPDLYANLAICYASKEDYKNALSTLNIAKDRFPANNLILKTLQSVQNDSLSTQLANASKAYEAKDYKKAIKLYMSVHPATEFSLMGVAASYQALADYNSAIEFYKKAEKINPNNLEIPYYIGYLYSEQKNWSLAEQYLQKAMQGDSKDKVKELLSYVEQNGSVTLLNEAITLFDQNNHNEALMKFNKVLQKETSNAHAYYYRGLIYDGQKQYTQAINDYLNVLKYSKDFAIVNYMIAVDYDTIEKYKEAYKYYQQFISTYTTDDEYLKYAKSRMEELKSYAS